MMSRTLVVCALACLVGSWSGAQEKPAGRPLPKVIKSSPCLPAPTIDGVLDDGEWRHAAPLELDLRMLRLIVSEDQIKGSMEAVKSGKAPPELATSHNKQWSITILDEGRPEPQLGHTKYACPRSHSEFFAQVLTGKIPASQLTRARLERLMDRYAGIEWLRAGLRHLDFAESALSILDARSPRQASLVRSGMRR